MDGIQGDDRLPACPSTGGYDLWTVELYKKQHEGREPPADHLDEAWIDWRAGLLNQFMKRMYQELKQVRPEAVISMAPSVFPWSKQQYLQDWPTWVASGWVDEVCPQIYRQGVTPYEAELNKIVNQQVSAANLHLVWPGILVQTADQVFNDADDIRAMVDVNRKAGLRGEVYFYDAALRKHRELFESLYESKAQP